MIVDSTYHTGEKVYRYPQLIYVDCYLKRQVQFVIDFMILIRTDNAENNTLNHLAASRIDIHPVSIHFYTGKTLRKITTPHHICKGQLRCQKRLSAPTTNGPLLLPYLRGNLLLCSIYLVS